MPSIDGAAGPCSAPRSPHSSGSGLGVLLQAGASQHSKVSAPLSGGGGGAKRSPALLLGSPLPQARPSPRLARTACCLWGGLSAVGLAAAASQADGTANSSRLARPRISEQSRNVRQC